MIMIMEYHTIPWNNLEHREAIESVLPQVSILRRLDYTSGVSLAGPLHLVTAGYEQVGDAFQGQAHYFNVRTQKSPKCSSL